MMKMFKRKVLRGLVKGAKGEGSRLENAIAETIIRTGKTGRSVRSTLVRATNPVNPEAGSMLVEGTIRGASKIPTHPATTGAVLGNTAVTAGLGAINPTLGAIHSASPVGVTTPLIPRALRTDKALVARYPGLKKAESMVAGLADTEGAKALGEFGNAVTRVAGSLYSLSDGSYTGPKDPVPGTLATVGGATAAGWLAGKVADKVTSDPRRPRLAADEDRVSWATKGAGAGFVTGVIGKILLGSIHNPMDTVKFDELDRAIQTKFGIYRGAGLTVGDSREARAKLKESFVINSRDLSGFKVHVCVVKGKLTLYTIGLSPGQETELEDTLDWYCRKYHGMDYKSSRFGSAGWKIQVTFTNHRVAADFLVEIGEAMGVRMNVMDSDASTELEEISQRSFSTVPRLDRLELQNLFGRGVLNLMTGIGPGTGVALIELVVEGLKALTRPTDAGIKNPRKAYGNNYLSDRLSRFGTEYTVGLKGAPVNLYLFHGTLIVSANGRSKEAGLLRRVKELNEAKSRSGSAVVWTYTMKSAQELDLILKQILGLHVKPNIYVP